MNDYYQISMLFQAFSHVDELLNEQYEYGTGFWCWVFNVTKWSGS